MHIQPLHSYGWSEKEETQFEPFRNRNLIAVKIFWEGRGYFRGTTGNEPLLLSCSGSFHTLRELGVQQTPVVGDWCAIQQYDKNRGLIEAVLPRSNEFHKPAAYNEQPTAVAANIDLGAITIDAKHDFSVRRVERFLALLKADAIKPILILTKIDLIDDIEGYCKRLASRFASLPIYPVDSLTNKGLEALREVLLPQSTTILLGRSGSGKSTLINALTAREEAKTAKVRDSDGRGRHTTTSRHLYRLANGALLLDTPGLRAIGLHSLDEDAFEDIALLARQCRYTDCTHTGESGCAVSKALLEGQLEQDRFLHYLTLREESRSSQEILAQRRAKDKAMGKLLYHYRREITHDRIK